MLNTNFDNVNALDSTPFDRIRIRSIDRPTYHHQSSSSSNTRRNRKQDADEAKQKEQTRAELELMTVCVVRECGNSRESGNAGSLGKALCVFCDFMSLYFYSYVGRFA
jgi:hypothetical protein